MSVNQSDVKEGRLNDQLEFVSAQVEANVERGKDALAEWGATLSDRSAIFAETMDGYAHKHPWRMISSALITGLLLGLLCGSQSSRRGARF